MTKIKRPLMYIFLTFVSLVSVFPFLWMIIGATNQSVDVTKGKLTFGIYFFENVKTLFQSTNIARAILNSVVVSVTTTLLAILISSAAGYGFVVYRSKIRERVFSVLLLSMMIPFAAIMLPLYRMFGKLNLLNSYAAVIIPSVATAFLIFFFRQNTQMFPKELLEASRIDGLNEWQIFIKIFMPTMKSTYAAAGIITFMSAWNSYLWPLVVMQTKESATLPLVISTLNSSYTPDYGVIMVAIVIATIPTALLFFAMQKRFVEGMLGSVK
ncbi:MAG: carbohydrate ABC transporter permease [Cellulosilyticaceae bacterium]